MFIHHRLIPGLGITSQLVQKHFLEKAGQKDLQQKRKQLLKIILQAKVLLEMSVQNIKLQILISSERGLSSIMVMRYLMLEYK